MRRISKTLKTIVTLVPFLFLAACQDEAPPVVSKPFVVVPQQMAPLPPKRIVALLLPLTGAQADTGQALRRGAEMAYFDHASNDTVLRFYDTKSTEQGVLAAAAQLVKDNPVVVVGPLLSKDCALIGPMLDRASITALTFSNDQRIFSPSLLSLGFLPQAQVEAFVAYARAKGWQRVAALLPANFYGDLLEDTLMHSADLQASGRLQTIRYPDSALPEAIAAIIESRGNQAFQAFFIPEGGLRSKAIAAQVRLLYPHARLVGSGQWDDPAVYQDPSFRGSLLTAVPPTAGRTQFEQRYSALYKEAPKRLATMAYDGTAMALIAQSVGDLKRPEGFVGLDGALHLMSTGQNRRDIQVLEMTGNGLAVASTYPDPQDISPAPTPVVNSPQSHSSANVPATLGVDLGRPVLDPSILSELQDEGR